MKITCYKKYIKLLKYKSSEFRTKNLTVSNQSIGEIQRVTRPCLYFSGFIHLIITSLEIPTDR